MAAALAGETRDSRLESSRQPTSRQRAGGWARRTVDGGRAFEDTRRDGGVNSDATVHCPVLELPAAGWSKVASCHQAGSGGFKVRFQDPSSRQHWNIGTLEPSDSLQGAEVGGKWGQLGRGGLTGSLARWFLALAISRCSLR